MKKKIVVLIVCLVVFIVIGYFMINNKNGTILQSANKKTIKQNNNSMLSMMLETSIGSGEYEKSTNSAWPGDGYAFNEELSKCENGSKLTWNDSTKTIVFSSNISDKCYVYFDIKAPIYWNDDFSNSGTYAYPETPSKTYNSLAELQAGYDDFASKPVYIKTTATEHQACLHYNNKEFCLGPNYWVGDSQDGVDGTTTKEKLQKAMATAFGISESDLSCDSRSNVAFCNVTSFRCRANSVGLVVCSGGGSLCGVYGDGTARCT